MVFATPPNPVKTIIFHGFRTNVQCKESFIFGLCSDFKNFFKKQFTYPFFVLDCDLSVGDDASQEVEPL